MPRRALLLASLLVTVVAQAQSVPQPTPSPSDSWSRPAPAASAEYAQAAPAAAAGSARSAHFEFTRRGAHEPMRNAAQEQSGKAAVGNMGMDRNGRPAVNCPQTPMDPACH